MVDEGGGCSPCPAYYRPRYDPLTQAVSLCATGCEPSSIILQDGSCQACTPHSKPDAY